MRAGEAKICAEFFTGDGNFPLCCTGIYHEEAKIMKKKRKAQAAA